MRSTAIVGVAFAALMGCNTLFSVEDLQFGGAGGADSSASSGETGPPGSGAGSATSSTGGGQAAGGGCAPENCLNGVDDDCDDLADCADPDCSEYACLPLPRGVTLAAFKAGECPSGTIEVQAATCDACSCFVTDAGSCGLTVEAWTNPTCAGASDDDVDVQASCVGITTIAANGTIGAKAHVNPNDDGTCAPRLPSAPSTTRSVCTLPEAGFCPNGMACLPMAAADLGCVMLEGDVACSLPNLPKKQRLSADGGTCACECELDDQTCPTDQHAHIYDDPACGGLKFDVEGDGLCQDTGLDEVEAAELHLAQPFPALSASCESDGAVQSAQGVNTLCCPND